MMPLDLEKPIFHRENQRLLRQLQHMEKHVDQWLKGYECLQAATENAIQLRSPGRGRDEDLFMLARTPNDLIAATQRERQLEQSLWRQWCCQGKNQPSSPFLPGVVRGFVSYQVPLRQVRADKQRAADLIGVTPQGHPAVAELKKENGDVPLWGLAEAYGYALALRKNWNAGELCKHWWHPKLPKKLESVPVLLVAPEAYWLSRTGIGNQRQAGELNRGQWQAFHAIVTRMSAAGFPVTTVAFDVEYGCEGLPRIHTPRIRTLPGL